MKVSWQWLSNYVDLEGIAVEDVTDRLTALGLEVEGVERGFEGLDGVVVATIVEASPHPDADRLQVCQVDAGGDPLTVVCGAPNARAGLVAPLARVGAVLPGSFEVARRAVRGVESSGMLCSRRELGFGDEHEGLWELDSAGSATGEPIEAYLRRTAPHLFDIVIELSITPNRGDCLSHLGVARELAAAFQRSLEAPETSSSENRASDAIDVEIDDDVGCPRYALTVLENVWVGPSPEWLRAAIEAVGARSVNNVVDVTNYVLFELGHPQHAFDADRLEGAVQVRCAHDDETIVAIDHETYELEAQDLVIADTSGPVAIAGVMGGAESEVTEATKRVALECAFFDASYVRRTAKRLGLHSESSHRFERGVDPSGVIDATDRAIALIVATQPEGREVSVSRTIDRHPRPLERPPVVLRPERVRALLGVDVANDRISSILESLGMAVAGDGSEWSVTVPSWRFDLEREADLIEEVARVWGVDRVPAVLPEGPLGHRHVRRAAPVVGRQLVAPTLVSSEELERVRRLRRTLRGTGCHEAVHFSFIDPADLEVLGFAEGDVRSASVRLRNPMSVEQSVLRTTLVPGLLAAVARNQAQQVPGIGLFELGRVFWRDGDDDVDADSGVSEPRMLCAVMTGRARNHWSCADAPAWDGHDLRGVVEDAAACLGIELSWSSCSDEAAPYLHPGVRLGIEREGSPIGVLGELHPTVCQAFGIDGPVFVAELRVDDWLRGGSSPVQFTPLPRFPASERDLALVVGNDVPFADVSAVVETNRPALLESWRLFDVYEGPGIEAGKRSLAMRFRYRDPNADDADAGRTLTDAEVQSAHAGLVAMLVSALDGEQR